jgi:RNA polymerase sigma-70 factor (family 1)
MSDSFLDPVDNRITGRQALSSATSISVKPDDELLIRRAFAMDAYEGCDLLFRRYYQPLCSHAARYVYSKPIAEDIVADLFQTFWQKKIYDRIDYSYRAYLYQAVRQNCLLYLRREAGLTVSTDQLLATDVLVGTTSPTDAIHFDELSERIDEVIRSLSPSVRKVFLLSRFEELRNQDIANELSISIKTVEAHLTKALSLFRKALRHE